MGILQKISWKTHRWNLKFNLLNIYLRDGDGCWGFSFCEVINKYRPYALLAFEFRLPNGANIKEFTVDNWDLLYLSTPLYDWYSDLSEDILWGSKPTPIQKIGMHIAKRLF